MKSKRRAFSDMEKNGLEVSTEFIEEDPILKEIFLLKFEVLAESAGIKFWTNGITMKFGCTNEENAKSLFDFFCEFS